MSKAPRGITRHIGAGDHAVVLVHGICQKAKDLYWFADTLHLAAPTVDIVVYDYDWLRPIDVSGRHLAQMLSQLPQQKLTLVGYSMGGLVSRLAAGGRANPHLRTVITLATPNNGAVSTSQLSILGQELAAAARRIAPVTPFPGILDLTRAGEIMFSRRQLPDVRANVATKRYASLPGLFFHEDRGWRPTLSKMGIVTALMSGLRLANVPKPHDGIVSERSNRLEGGDDRPWSEIDFAGYDGASSARCHAVHVDARAHDHVTVLKSPGIAALVAHLAVVDDWDAIPSHPDVRLTRSGI